MKTLPRSLPCLVSLSALFFCGSQVASATTPPVVADGQVALAAGFDSPQGVAVGGDGAVYVADMGNNQVVKVSAAGVVTPVSVSGQTLNGPTAVAVDANGNLYIADAYNSRVLEVQPSGTVTQVAGPPALSLPVSLAVDASNNLYIGDGGNFAVYKVTPGGPPVQVALSGTSNVFAYALTTDSSGNLYIADANSGFVYKLPAGQTAVQNVTPTGFTLNSPDGLAFDAAGNFYVLDSGNTRIIEAPAASGSTPFEVPVTGLSEAAAMALDRQGNIYVTDVLNNNLTELIYAGNAINLGQVGVGSTGPAVAVNYELNTAETLSAFKFSMQGDTRPEASIGSGTTCQFQTYSNAPPTSSNPISATNPFVCVADVQGSPAYLGTRKGAISLLNSSNAQLLTLPFFEIGVAPAAWIAPGVASTVVTGLMTPQGIAISGQNNIVYIADSNSGKVYSWNGLNGSGSTLTSIIIPGIPFSSPSAVALNSAGDLYIADNGLNEIVVLPANTATPPFVLATGSLLHFPTSLTFDVEGNLYIGDGGPDGINATAATPGSVIRMPVSGGSISTLNTSPANVVFPQALTTDPAGNLYIADGGPVSGSGNPQVVLVPASGAAPSVVNVSGLISPAGLAMDPAGDLWVLDEGNLNKFTIVPPGGGSPYTLPLVAPMLSGPSQMLFTAGNAGLLISDIASNQLALVSGLQSQLTFPVTAVGASSASQAASILSIGNSPLKPSNTSGAFTETGTLAEFQIANSSIFPTFTQLAPAQSGALAATFTPNAEGAAGESVNSLFNSANQVQLLLNGTTTNGGSVTPAPTFFPASGGPYTLAQTVTISDSAAGAVIHYTTDGSVPTISSPTYSGPIDITGGSNYNTVVSAIAIASGLSASPVASATYSFNPFLGDNDFSYAGGDYSGAINSTYAKTGPGSGGYTVTSCSFYQPTGTVTQGAKMDCGLILAPTPTTEASSWLCHAAYTNPTSSGLGGWVTVALSGCGTLPANTGYWIATNSNDPIPGFPYGFSTCGGACNGPAPTVGNGNYEYWWVAAAYGKYTGLTANMNETGAPYYQASQYVTLGVNPPGQAATPVLSPGTGTYVTTQTVTITDGTSGAVIYYTTDGSVPTASSAVYHTALTVTGTETISALAVAPGYTNSAIATATYTFAPYLGTPTYTSLGGDYAGNINSTYAVTGSNAHGYTVTSCSFYQPTGTITNHAKMDCGLILAPTATTQATSWLCHATYTNTSTHGAGAWITVPLTGCGTLPAGTAYWIGTDSNDPIPNFPYGLWNCGGSCTGTAPTVGNGTYGYRYITVAYGTYTGMGTSMLATGTPGRQAAQYVTLSAAP